LPGGWIAHQGSGGISTEAEGAKNLWGKSGGYLDKWKDIKIGTVNAGTLLGKSREMVEMLGRRRLDYKYSCVQKKRWQGKS